MRKALLALPLLVGLVAGGFQCAHADPNGAQACAWYPTEDCPDANLPVPTIEVVSEGMEKLPTYSQDGRSYVLGGLGRRYRIRIVNPTPARVEAVVSVDGLDIVDGHPASLEKRGYIVAPYGQVTVDGWRTSLDTVAAFRFSSVRNSYAGRTDQARNVGVIGAAFFKERARVHVVRAAPATPAPVASPLNAGPRGESADSYERSAPAEKSAAATSRGAAAAAPSAVRPGLGTEFGEAQASTVVETQFVRAESRPSTVAQLRYDDRDGLLSRGIVVDFPAAATENSLRDRANPFPLSRFAEAPPPR